MAYEQFEAPQEQEVVEVEPQMKVMGKTLKQAAKAVVEHLGTLSDDDALALKVCPSPATLMACTTLSPRGTFAQHVEFLCIMARPEQVPSWS